MSVQTFGADEPFFGLTNRFEAIVDDFKLGGWAKCEGLAVSFELEKYVPLGQNDYEPILPIRVSYPPIKLTRAINRREQQVVMKWLSKMAAGSATATGQIILMNSHREPVTSWNLRGVYPTKWSGPGRFSAFTLPGSC